MAPTDHPVDPAWEKRTTEAGREAGLDEPTRQRLLAVLYRELADSTSDALARGVPQEKLAAHLAERAAVLRARITKLSSVEVSVDASSGDDVTNDIGNAA